MEKEHRPDPEALLQHIEQQKRGRLTVFLGAAAGVGKTYAMLEAAQERLKEGVDVVVGWVETHGRAETEALLKGLNIIPPRRLTYRGKEFFEMDLDALLSRRPALALVDELAHSNVPGSRHSKRYQDVEELLDAGIDVHTTLNIQHLESLNDIVAQITGIRVRETVPDRVLETAEIRLIDVPPEELILRFKEGKVYVPEMAQEALRRFFRPGNINALRELALRYAAKRADRQLENYMRAHGIPGPWPAGERVMVCVSPSPFSARLIRIARRMAEGLEAEWLALYVDTPGRSPAQEEEKERLAENLRLAEELGAETITLSGEDVAEEILELARKRNVTHIVIGKPLRSKFWELVHGSVVDKVIRQSQGISVHVIPGKHQPPEKIYFPSITPPLSWTSYAGALGAAFLVAGFCIWWQYSLGLVNIAMLLLLPVLFSAVRWGVGPAVAASISGFLLFDFLFLPPTGSFSISDLRYIISFVIFELVALFTGTLSNRLKAEVRSCRERGDRLATLYSLSRDIAAVAELKPVLDKITQKVSETLELPVAVLLPDKEGKLQISASSEDYDGNFWDENERAVANWVFKNGHKAGRGTDTLSGSGGLYLPLQVGEEVQGVLGISLKDSSRGLQPDQLRLAEAFVGLAALAITRLKLQKEAQEARFLAESERLRTALFNSLSHDLRTPLASIIGAVTSLLEGDRVFDDTSRRELLQTIKQEANRMNRFVSNLLDMARLESGLLKLRQEWVDIEDVIGVATSRLGEALKSRPLTVKMDPDLPLIKADSILIEQVLVNLLDNALKYSPPGSEISLTVSCKEGSVEISVSNKGPRLSSEELERIFDKFYRIPTSPAVGGTGLGLAICKGIVEAHGGQVWARNHPEGLTITFTLPLPSIGPGEIPPARVGEIDGN
ncbi:MAG: sensor histidine kinase KdpD [Candidatus Fermentithermobacillus carboniphilus]|uniref:histidine kinase n=1 Tax=Candidatus Fermentithermobacillus carboniphilus TaxID=3085328 RepID=A0AAT9LEI9_9FIRM|nr:MAG: sensor histidine kinase KdpD [Candidatus Fermentithermobacillus carboniphilus]